MFEVCCTDGTILFPPVDGIKRDTPLSSKKLGSFLAKTIDDRPGAALMVVIELGPRSFKESIMVQEL